MTASIAFTRRGTTPRRMGAATLATVLVGTLVAGGAAAQTPRTPGQAAPSLVTSPTYRIAVEDVLDISVLEHAEFNRVLAVNLDGTIDFPLSGQINVVGMTIAQLKARITRDLAKQYVKPQVSIGVRERQARSVSILGAVRAPGKRPLKEGEKLLELLADAGGLPSERAEFYVARLIRTTTGEVFPIDLVKLYANDASQNLVLSNNDTILVEELEASKTTIQVVGEVGRPGPQAVPRDGSIISVLQLAGGPTARAQLSKVTLERGGQLIYLDMRDYQKNGFDPKEKLVAGDKLIIPENKREYYIFGPVARPGTQIYPDDRQLTVYSALANAGGSTEGVDLKKTRLIHPNADGTTTTQIVDIQTMLKTGNLNGDLPVVPGDTISVPPSGSRRGLSAFEAIGLVGGIFTILNYFRRR